MSQKVTFDIGDTIVQFTPDGRISVLDAISALGAYDEPNGVWEGMKKKDPEMDELCDSYVFGNGEEQPVLDKDNWDRFESLLLAYLIETT